MSGDPPKSAMDAVLDRIFGFNGDGVLSVRNLCYAAFSAAKSENTEDGGPTDWMNDTLPMVDTGIAKLRALLVQELIGAGLVLNAAGETQGALHAARETQGPSRPADIMSGARASSDVRWHILRVAYEEARYRPGDHPVVPVRMADFMTRVGILLSDQSPVGDDEASWPVRGGSSGRPFEVLLPDGSWMPVTAVTQEHARRLAGSEWQLESAFGIEGLDA